ncbi:MAG: hypothetical protein WBF75_10395 [Pseudonocardiaceae bacterium]
MGRAGGHRVNESAAGPVPGPVSRTLPPLGDIPASKLWILRVTVRKASADPGSAQNNTEVAMNWWGWVILALVIVVALAAFAVVVQRKRRRGGVIGLNDPGRSDSR